MASNTSHSRGETTDRSTDWSQDDQGHWYSRSYNYLGEEERHYHQPAAQVSERTPRTPGDTNFQRSLYQNYESLSGNASYTTAIFSNNPRITSPSSYNTYPRQISVSGSNNVASQHNPNTLGNSQFSYNTFSEQEDNSWGGNLPSTSTSGPFFAPPSRRPTAYSATQEKYGNSDYEYNSDKTYKTQDLTLRSIPAAYGQGTPETSTSGQLRWQRNSGSIIRNPQSSQSSEQLDPRYQVIESKKLDRFWRVGRVFMMLWTEPARNNTDVGKSRNGSHYSVTYLNGQAYSEIRRFVVLRKNHGNCISSPIHTYSGQATLKANLPDAKEHAIIYTSPYPPDPHVLADKFGSVRKEDLDKDPIRVNFEGKDDDQYLSETSRLNYNKTYTVENYVRVLNIGMVHPNYMETLALNSVVRPNHNVHKSSQSGPNTSSKDDTENPQRKSSKDEKKKIKPSGSGRRR